MEKAPTLEEFQECVRESYQTLLESGRYRELPKRSGEFVNHYSMRIGNRTTVIEVEGIHYGTGAWLKVYRASEADIDDYGLPIDSLLNQRAPISKKTKKSGIGQLAEIRRDASRILANATDVLFGDFSAVDKLIESQRKLEEERQAKAPGPKLKAANIASSEAGHAFKAGDFTKTVSLLGPHLDLLSNAQRTKYQIALERIKNPSLD